MNAPHRLALLAPEPVEPDGVDRADDLPGSALDAWWQVRDVWLRLLASHTLRVCQQADSLQVEWAAVSDPSTADASTWQACGDPDRYAWLDCERRRSLLQALDVGDGRVTMTLAPARSMRLWPDGPCLVAEIQCFLQRYAQTP